MKKELTASALDKGRQITDSGKDIRGDIFIVNNTIQLILDRPDDAHNRQRIELWKIAQYLRISRQLIHFQLQVYREHLFREVQGLHRLHPLYIHTAKKHVTPEHYDRRVTGLLP
jgi:hypothetical protein